jgi:hypothetical protein
MCASRAEAVDLNPYLEYQVATTGFPTRYFLDIDEAAVEVAERECQIFGNTNCAVTRKSYFNSLYFVDYSYKCAEVSFRAGSRVEKPRHRFDA